LASEIGERDTTELRGLFESASWIVRNVDENLKNIGDGHAVATNRTSKHRLRGFRLTDENVDRLARIRAAQPEPIHRAR
jgi:hypothetical protein